MNTDILDRDSIENERDITETWVETERDLQIVAKHLLYHLWMEHHFAMNEYKDYTGIKTLYTQTDEILAKILNADINTVALGDSITRLQYEYAKFFNAHPDEERWISDLYGEISTGFVCAYNIFTSPTLSDGELRTSLLNGIHNAIAQCYIAQYKND